MSRLETCRAAAGTFHLGDEEAGAIIDGRVAVIRDGWKDVCDEAELSPVDRAFMWRRQFLNDFAFDGYAGERPEARF